MDEEMTKMREKRNRGETLRRRRVKAIAKTGSRRMTDKIYERKDATKNNVKMEK